MKLRCFLLAVPSVLAIAPTAALAAGSVKAGYGGGAGVQNEVGQTAGVAAGGSLPFTGLDLALLVIGGLMLLVVGMVLRRAVKRTT